MVKTLFFDYDKNNKKVINKYPKEIQRGDVIWSHLLKEEDNAIDAILNEIGETEEFEEDLIETQRPRYTRFKKYAVLVLSFPTPKTIHSKKENLDMNQITFIIMKNKLISITEKPNKEIEKIMKKAAKKKTRQEPTTLLSKAIEELTEKAVETISDYDFEIEKKEKKILEGDKKSFEQIQQMKENLFYALKTMEANAEAIRNLEEKNNPVINKSKINTNIKNRLLYGADMIEKNRENITNLTNIYLSVLSHKLNEYVHKVTIIGAILMIPTIISGLFGMNVPLPQITFNQIIGICLTLSIITLAYFKAKKWI